LVIAAVRRTADSGPEVSDPVGREVPAAVVDSGQAAADSGLVDSDQAGLAAGPGQAAVVDSGQADSVPVDFDLEGLAVGPVPAVEILPRPRRSWKARDR
jgi:hypothetical protein